MTKYSPELIEKTKDYLLDHQEYDDMIPSIAGLACVIGVTRQTIHVWMNDPEKPEWSDLMDHLSTRQERLLLSGGLSGEYSAVITKLVLAKHGYHDKTDNEHYGKGGKPLQWEVIDGPGKPKDP